MSKLPEQVEEIVKEEEKVGWYSRPHVSKVIGSVIGGIFLGGFLGIFGFIFTLSLLDLVPAVGVGLGILVVVAGIVIGLTYWETRNRVYVVTNRRIIDSYEGLSSSQEEIGVDRVQNINRGQSYIEKLFDLGDIEVSTAAGSDDDINITHIEEPKKAKSVVKKAMENKKSKEKTYDKSREEKGDEIIEEIKSMNSTLEKINQNLK